MIRTLAPILTALFVATATQTTDFEIVVGDHFGPIHETTTRAQLSQLFGKDAVKDVQVPIGEGMCVPGAVVFQNHANEVEITWQDKARTRVAFARVQKPAGNWHTRRGVRVGTTLRELEAIAGKVLVFLGFGSDYGGGMEWTEDGKSLRLEINPEEGTTLPRDVSGDREVRSDHPPNRKMKNNVTWMRQDWGSPSGETECR
jgi:hypothetical protein